MKKLISLFLFVFCSLPIVFGQLGITAGFVKYEAPDFNNFFENKSDLDFSKSKNFDGGNYQVAVDYWFRLKKKRLEFLPEISFTQAKAKLTSVAVPDFGYEYDLSVNMIQFNFNTQIYPFDFEGDCNCPTFSKDGELLKKGFFIRVAPGITYSGVSNTYSSTSIGGVNTFLYKDSGIAYNLRAGIGLDIGVTDFITITPLAQYTFVSEAQISVFEDPSFPEAANNFGWRQLFVGIRMGFRFDELNKFGYR